MPHQVAIVGAGGKMGVRAAQKIGLHPEFGVLMCESHPKRAAWLAEQGYTVTALPQALAEADFVFLAVPDALIGTVAREAAPLMKPGAMLIMLDAAAAYVGDLPESDHIAMMITHPCHPPMFTDQPTPEERADYFGGIARQHIIVCLVRGGACSEAVPVREGPPERGDSDDVRFAASRVLQRPPARIQRGSAAKGSPRQSGPGTTKEGYPRVPLPPVDQVSRRAHGKARRKR
jgi:hypothetical protein